MSDTQRFPILKARYAHTTAAERAALAGLPDTLPWEMVEAYADRARKNHGQTVERLAERGGLCVIELACLFNDKTLRFCQDLTFERAVAIVQQQIDDWAAMTLADLEAEDEER